MRKGCGTIVIVSIGLVILLWSFGQPVDVSNDINTSQNSMGSSEQSLVSSLPPKKTWVYDQSIDKMSDKLIQYATIESNNQVAFDFPYDGGSTLTVTIRQHPRYGTDVMLGISKGHFLCNSYDGCQGRIRIGDGRAENVALVEPDDHSVDTLFVVNDQYWIRKLKAANSFTIALPFYQEGNRQFTFDTKNLEWPRPAPGAK